MYKLFKMATVTTSVILIANISLAQDAKIKSKKEKSQEIIIRKKDGKTEKMTIVVDGENITINGKPANDFEAADVMVMKRKTPFPPKAPSARSFRSSDRDMMRANSNFNIAASVNKAMLGVLTEKADNGVKIKEVTKESGAEKAGLQKDDIITKVGETEVDTPRDLVEAINKHKPNDKVDITYNRNGKENKTTATLGENQKDFSFNFDDKDFDFEMPDVVMPPMENFDFHFNRKPKIGLQIQDLEEGKGVNVRDVDEDSPAFKAGLKEGDVISQVNEKDVEGVDELRDIIRDLKEGDSVKFTYKRDGKNQTANVKIPKRLKSADL